MTTYKFAVECYQPCEKHVWEDEDTKINGLVLFNVEAESSDIADLSKMVFSQFLKLPTEEVRIKYSSFFKIWSSGDQYWFKVFPKDSLATILGEPDGTEILYDRELNLIEQIPDRFNEIDRLLESL